MHIKLAKRACAHHVHEELYVSIKHTRCARTNLAHLAHVTIKRTKCASSARRAPSGRARQAHNVRVHMQRTTGACAHQEHEVYAYQCAQRTSAHSVYEVRACTPSAQRARVHDKCMKCANEHQAYGSVRATIRCTKGAHAQQAREIVNLYTKRAECTGAY